MRNTRQTHQTPLFHILTKLFYLFICFFIIKESGLCKRESVMHMGQNPPGVYYWNYEEQIMQLVLAISAIRCARSDITFTNVQLLKDALH